MVLACLHFQKFTDLGQNSCPTLVCKAGNSKILCNILYATGTKGPTQVKCRLLISSIFDVMNFQHFSEMLEFNL